MEFRKLGLPDWLVSTCAIMGMKAPTQIQKQTIPALLSGEKLILAASSTGSGKTAAVVLPILAELAKDPASFFALILTPTRELAIQINEQVIALGKAVGCRSCLIVGGHSSTEQRLELEAKPHVVIATPGRLAAFLRDDVNHLREIDEEQKKHENRLGEEGEDDNNNYVSNVSRSLNLSTALTSKLRYVVLDEADQLLSQQFEEALTTIMEIIKSKRTATDSETFQRPSRQTILLSATMEGVITTLKEDGWLKKAFIVDQTQKEQRMLQVKALSHRYIVVPQRVKEVYVYSILKNRIGLPETGQHKMIVARKINKSAVLTSENLDNGEITVYSQSRIIFASTCFICEWLALTLRELGIKVVALHSRMKQQERLESLQRFRAGAVDTLIATDLASRGLDIPSVSLVINYDVPADGETYLHRVGRTARAGRYGTALTCISEFDLDRVRAIETELSSPRIMQALDSPFIDETKVMEYLTEVIKAKRTVRLFLFNSGLWEKQLLLEHRKAKASIGQKSDKIKKAKANGIKVSSEAKTKRRKAD